MAGILEVNDQLGMRGMEYAREEHTNIFKLSLEIVSATMGFSHIKIFGHLATEKTSFAKCRPLSNTVPYI